MGAISVILAYSVWQLEKTSIRIIEMKKVQYLKEEENYEIKF